MVTKMTQAKQRAQALKKQMVQTFEQEIIKDRQLLTGSFLNDKPWMVRDVKVRKIGHTFISLKPKKISWIKKVKDYIIDLIYSWTNIIIPNDRSDLVGITQYMLEKGKIKTQVYIITVTTNKNEQLYKLIDPNELLKTHLAKFVDHIRSYNA